MGWFSTKMDGERATNLLLLHSVKESFEESHSILTNAKQFVDGQVHRAQGLTAQAFSIQGASSSIGRSLQQAINQLGSFNTHVREIISDLEERQSDLGVLQDQYSLPRVERAVNMSGREIGERMRRSAQEVLHNRTALKRNHFDNIAGAVASIDQADASLNGANSVRARPTMPRFD